MGKAGRQELPKGTPQNSCVSCPPSIEVPAPEGMDIPGFRLHPLKGRMRGYHAVSVSGNWRVAFRFDDGSAVDVDYLDYH